MTEKLWSKDIFVGNPVTYDEAAAPIKTYCSECGHETGEEQPHAKECACLGCDFARKMAPHYPDLVGRKITFRHIEGVR